MLKTLNLPLRNSFKKRQALKKCYTKEPIQNPRGGTAVVLPLFRKALLPLVRAQSSAASIGRLRCRSRAAPFRRVGFRGRESSETNLLTGEKFTLEFSKTSEGLMKVRRPAANVLSVDGVSFGRRQTAAALTTFFGLQKGRKKKQKAENKRCSKV